MNGISVKTIMNRDDSRGISTSSTKRTKNAKDSKMEQLCAKICGQAKTDAKKHIYMSDDFTAMKETYKRNNISPNRALLKSRVSGLLTSTGLTNGKYIPFQVMGVKGYTGRINMGLLGACMDIYDRNGEVVLSYTHPPNGGWIPKQTKAEEQFERQITDVYYEAYKAAVQEQKAAQNASVQSSATVTASVESTTSGFDMKA